MVKQIRDFGHTPFYPILRSKRAMSFTWVPEPCTCKTDTPCTAKLLREHFKNVYFMCKPVGIEPGTIGIEGRLYDLYDQGVIQKYVSKLTHEALEKDAATGLNMLESTNLVFSPPQKAVPAKTRHQPTRAPVKKCQRTAPATAKKCHQWRKYGTKYGKNKIQREYYKCNLCDMRKRVQLKNNIQIACNIGHKK